MKEIAEKIIKKLKEKNFESEIFYNIGHSTSLKIKENEIEDLNISQVEGVALRIFKDGKVGFSYAQSFASQQDLIEQAIASAENSSSDEANQIPYSLLPLPDLDEKFLYDENLFNISLEEKINKLKLTENIARQADSRIKKVLQVSYGENGTKTFLINSKGLFREERGTFVSLGVVSIAAQNEEIKIGADFCARRIYQQIPFAEVAEKASKRAISLLGAKKIPTAQLPIILDPLVACEFLEVFGEAILADNVLNKKSILAGKIGQKISSEQITIIDDGILKGGVGTSFFDGEGIPSQRTIVVENGILKSYLYDNYTALKDKKISTGNSSRSSHRSLPSIGMSNFYIEKGNKDFKEMISDFEKGLYVTSTLGFHTVDPISGNFSVGIEGSYFSKGEISFPVHGITLAGNIFDLFQKIEGVGDDLKFYGNLGSPSLEISPFTIGGED